MSSHCAILACTMPNAPNATGTTSVRHCKMQLTSTHKSIRRQEFVFLFLKQMLRRLAPTFLAVEMAVCHVIVMSSVSTSILRLYRYHLLSMCHHHPLCRASGVFTLNWVPTNLARKSQKSACFCIIHMALETGISTIDCMCYRDFTSSEQYAQ